MQALVGPLEDEAELAVDLLVGGEVEMRTPSCARVSRCRAREAGPAGFALRTTSPRLTASSISKPSSQAKRSGSPGCYFGTSIIFCSCSR
ncbi:hypothetical protein [Streptomyces marianii]|uniref:hypothetical protein n=1 Tax=Streptomyces marianii TaxID=1817406 RepID=UPI001486762F|nr:hypothetical protein [Streptomyces marianii]